LGPCRLQILDVDARLLLELPLTLALALRDEIDLPAGQLRREARVLAPLADGERELVVRDGDQDLLLSLDHLGLEHFRRAQGAGHEDDRVVAEGNDVDLLAPQLTHDRPARAIP
jgi:hypothetical protein